MAKPDDEPKAPQSQDGKASQAASEPVPPVSFDQLAAGKKEVQIEHRGQVYRLRATRNGGLILNK